MTGQPRSRWDVFITAVLGGVLLVLLCGAIGIAIYTAR